MPNFLNEPLPDTMVRLECGTLIDLKRPRWDGPLSRNEVEACRNASIALAYDPVQIGWVMATKQTREEWAVSVSHTALPQCDAPEALDSGFRLRPWRAEDVDAYVALLDDPAVWTYMPEAYPDPLSRDLALSLIELSNASNHHQVRAVIANGQPVGQVRLLFEADEQLGGAEISYWLGRAHWGQGIARTVVDDYSAIVLAQHPQIGSLFARVHKDNIASARVLRRAGYAETGPDPLRAGWRVYRRNRSA